MSGWGEVQASKVSMRTSNPIRKIVDQLPRPKEHKKNFVQLSIGDPSVGGEFPPHENCAQAVADAASSNKRNGYFHSAGLPEVRQVVAEKFTEAAAPLNADDIILTSGCSGAIEMSISVLCNEGDTILLPRPGFSLYKTIADSKGLNTKFYNLKPDKSWAIDVNHLRSLVDDTVTCILVNSPSNPCGSICDANNLKDVLKVADDHKIPIISDEIYRNMAFPDSKIAYVPMATLTTTVPILTVGGLAKQYLIPGWRMGWILIHDRQDAFKSVRRGLLALTTLLCGACSIVQAAIPTIITKTPKEFYDNLNAKLQLHAKTFCDAVTKIDGLTPVEPQGAMYCMVGIEMDKFSFSDDVQFCKRLLEEQNLQLLPGQVFGLENFIRVVITGPLSDLQEATSRLREFCDSHRNK